MYKLRLVAEMPPNPLSGHLIFKNFLGGACPQTPLDNPACVLYTFIPSMYVYSQPMETPFYKSCIRPCCGVIVVLILKLTTQWTIPLSCIHRLNTHTHLVMDTQYRSKHVILNSAHHLLLSSSSMTNFTVV